jgi:hypothetical protein
VIDKASSTNILARPLSKSILLCGQRKRRDYSIEEYVQYPFEAVPYNTELVGVRRAMKDEARQVFKDETMMRLVWASYYNEISDAEFQNG